MRSFPRTARRRLAAASLACAVAAGALAAPQANADDLKDRQKHVQGQIHSATHDLGESSKRLRRATVALDRARSALADARDELHAARHKRDAAQLRDEEMKKRLAEAEERLANAQADLATGQQALDDQHEQVTDTITSIYEEGDPELIVFSSLLDAQSPADLTRRMEARNVIVGRETRAYDDLHAAEVLLAVRKDEVQKATDEVEVQRRAAAEHLVTMRKLVDETRAASQKVHELVDSRRSARQAASRAHAHDRAALARLRKQERRIKQRILAQAQHAHGGYRGSTGGFLERPVANSYVTSPFGYREHPIYHYWGLHDGDDFHAPCGTPLRAAGSGTVMSEYYSSVWGNRLYLNLGTVNGKNVTVIYNHLSRYRVGGGAHVSRGEIVGYAGTTGWSTACHLHFTVMVNGTPVNPMNWF
ncbi:peptidoglycan DD-metalloendopeptidase family protein [Nocardioides sp. MAHUQ-72]|uniref:peptidoglycan DD-metalloendopeptidase family protein n=1 Tax=unclassified Nocardioides TaxID=2615069 RepID=UPI00361716E0